MHLNEILKAMKRGAGILFVKREAGKVYISLGKRRPPRKNSFWCEIFINGIPPFMIPDLQVDRQETSQSAIIQVNRQNQIYGTS
jgi:hypothetical protein